MEAMRRRVKDTHVIRNHGRVVQLIGLVIESEGPLASVGELCRIESARHEGETLAEVVGFSDRAVLLMAHGELEGVHPGAMVTPLGRSMLVGVGPGLLGRVLDGMGQPIDGGPPLQIVDRVPMSAAPPNPLTRASITEPLVTGVRAIDGLLTIGRGQRIGIFAGSGVGKSTLLGMIARKASADVNVIALLGERGREVREFMEHSLGPEGLARSVVIVATGDQSALARSRGASVATAIAEYFRDQGKHVLLMLDSVTRVAMAWREIGLAVGEPPTTKGYPPSVFAALPRLLERAGTSSTGAITALYTVLVDGDDFNEPVADAARSILDGHLVLSRKLAGAGHYPSIDVMDSKSRVRDAVIPKEQVEAATTLLRCEASYREQEDLILVGAYQKGADPMVDAALELRPTMLDFLRQSPHEHTSYGETVRRLSEVSQGINTAARTPTPGAAA